MNFKNTFCYKTSKLAEQHVTLADLMEVQMRKSKADQTVEGMYIIMPNISKGTAFLDWHGLLQIVAFGNLFVTI